MVDDGTVHPAAFVFQLLWQVPVVERREGGDAVLEEAVHEAAVKVETRGVDGSAAAGEDTRLDVELAEAIRRALHQ